MMKTGNLLIVMFILFFVASCDTNNAAKNEPTDTPTSGEVSICVDESYTLLFDAEIYAFESIYDRAKIKVNYLPESEALKLLLNDSCKVAFLNRDLSVEEKKIFEANNIFPKSTKIAEDAVAFIVNKENPDSVFTTEQINAILSGNDSLWNQISATNSKDKINVVFDNTGSANARYMQDSLLGGKPFGQNIFAVKSNPEVIEYVNKNKNAIGVISVNWISDSDDTLSRGFLNKIKVVGIKKDTSAKAYKPYQAYIKTKEYAFCRDVFAINRQTRAGLGMGFVSYVAGEKGQLIILKAGMVPAIAPVRLVQINTK